MDYKDLMERVAGMVEGVDKGRCEIIGREVIKYICGYGVDNREALYISCFVFCNCIAKNIKLNYGL